MSGGQAYQTIRLIKGIKRRFESVGRADDLWGNEEFVTSGGQLLEINLCPGHAPPSTVTNNLV